MTAGARKASRNDTAFTISIVLVTGVPPFPAKAVRPENRFSGLLNDIVEDSRMAPESGNCSGLRRQLYHTPARRWSFPTGGFGGKAIASRSHTAAAAPSHSVSAHL